MTVCDWDWQAISGFFQGFMTLGAGVAAVIGAVKIGKRQLAIAEAQTEILRRQTDIQDAGWRQSLFDRRMKIYEAAIEFMLEIGDIGAVSDIKTNQLHRAQLDSEFLFGPPVTAFLGDLYRHTIDLNKAHVLMKGSKGPIHDTDLLQTYDEAKNVILEDIARLIDVFSEMKLTRDV